VCLQTILSYMISFPIVLFAFLLFYFLHMFIRSCSSFTITILFRHFFLSCFICFGSFILCWSLLFPCRISLINFLYILSLVLSVVPLSFCVVIQLPSDSEKWSPDLYHLSPQRMTRSCELRGPFRGTLLEANVPAFAWKGYRHSSKSYIRFQVSARTTNHVCK
jgi:hypothetical protein